MNAKQKNHSIDSLFSFLLLLVFLPFFSHRWVPRFIKAVYHI